MVTLKFKGAVSSRSGSKGDLQFAPLKWDMLSKVTSCRAGRGSCSGKHANREQDVPTGKNCVN